MEKRVFKKAVLCVKEKGKLEIFLVLCNECLMEINLKKY